MLAVQVQYWTLQEDIRHNKAVESETYRHNVAQENYWQADLGEKIRHNQAQEGYWSASLAEETRHNLVQEQIGYQNVAASMYAASVSRQNTIDTVTQRYAELTNTRQQYEKSLTEQQRQFNTTTYLNVEKEKLHGWLSLGESLARVISGVGAKTITGGKSK